MPNRYNKCLGTDIIKMANRYNKCLEINILDMPIIDIINAKQQIE